MRNGKPELEVKFVLKLYEEASRPGTFGRRIRYSASTVLHTNLGNAYLEMWVQQQTRTDIANAIECYEQARRPSNDGNQKQKMMATIKLATALSTRCEQQRNTIRLNEAIVFLEDTSKFFKPSDGSKNLRYTRSEYELGNAHNVRYKRGNSVEDLNLGILRFQNAVDSYPEGDEDSCPAQFALSQTLLVRHQL